MCKVLPKRPVGGVVYTNFVSKQFDTYVIYYVCIWIVARRERARHTTRRVSSIISSAGRGAEINKKIGTKKIFSDVFWNESDLL